MLLITSQATEQQPPGPNLVDQPAHRGRRPSAGMMPPEHIDRPTPCTTSRRARKRQHDPLLCQPGLHVIMLCTAHLPHSCGDAKFTDSCCICSCPWQSHLNLRCSPLHHTPTTTSMPSTPKQPITTMLIIPSHPCCLNFHAQHDSTACLHCPRLTAAATSLGMGPGHASTKNHAATKSPFGAHQLFKIPRVETANPWPQCSSVA